VLFACIMSPNMTRRLRAVRSVANILQVASPYRKLPRRITRRLASRLVAEALGHTQLAAQLRTPDDSAPLELREVREFSIMLQSTPDAGSPAVNWEARLVDRTTLARWAPPRIAETVVGSARPADHAGALYDEEGSALHEPQGSIEFWRTMVAGLALRGHAAAPKVRPGGGRAGRPVSLDLRGVLRILLRLVERCRPSSPTITPVTCVALLLWLDGHCRPPPPPPEDQPDLPDHLALNDLPILSEEEPSVVRGTTMGSLVRAIRDLTRGRAGEYGYIRQKRRAPVLTRTDQRSD
jgi:hypothetical protein